MCAASTYYALPVDPNTGAGKPDGGIKFAELLGSYAKTLGAAVGVPASLLDTRISLGKIVPAALV